MNRSSLPDLILRFDCNQADTWADEFQHHLVDRKLISAAVQKETHDNEIWLSYPNLKGEAIKRIVSEAHPWCLDRGLGVLEGKGEGGASQATVLMIADLTKVVE